MSSLYPFVNITPNFTSQPSSSRRDFLKSSGGLTIAFWLGSGVDLLAGETLAADELPESLAKNPRINAWLEVLADGRVRVLTGKTEIGQGIRTAVAQLAVEELDLPMERVEVVLAETGRTPDERYTSGSASIESSGMSIRYAAAAARQQLLALAARQLSVLRQPAPPHRWRSTHHRRKASAYICPIVKITTIAGRGEIADSAQSQKSVPTRRQTSTPRRH
ncbi:Aerobic-type carbon monoxide dehydrogenase large subunit CoxL/CutL [Hymenobacter roseosalivarius DSM 11622]|uniref:Aerobic-type carbon monoxide dehydrogenase large subunit CoxL/CutL n=1 Tax=Hymenobacter roseosalivarius DSM 11622 TaxID=645990 RepID=A0A1W1W189_9BACT|nr:molybdopterin cofactor-binding domain-containing protein [Hymenobacter roseosalivarius]SMB99402.1 Aerobic-type carbon monoxide dehydrogenase large subunit CoxL/CutL [Hymenobacter roseosalivarius DSM 11622]